MCQHEIKPSPFLCLFDRIGPNLSLQRESVGRKPKTTGPTARAPGAFKSVLTRMGVEGWRALRMLAVENDTTLNALAVEAFNDLLKKYGKRQSVENPLLED